jgi:hypothetical protein
MRILLGDCSEKEHTSTFKIQASIISSIGKQSDQNILRAQKPKPNIKLAHLFLWNN